MMLVWTLLLFSVSELVSGARLSEFILHYEPVHYDVRPLARVHPRSKRSITSRPQLKLRFNALNREFRVRLQADGGVLDQDVQFYVDDEPFSFDTTRVYVGSLEDDDGSTVTGVIDDDGLFDGTINTPSERYHVEPASRYAISGDHSLHHTVVYRASDVLQPNGSALGCPCEGSHQLEDREVLLQEGQLSGAQEAGRTSHVTRSRRSVSDPVKKSTCTLYLQADHLFHEQMGSEEASIQAMIRHVQQANDIYKFVDFDSDGIQDNIGFIIKRIRVHTAEALQDPNYRYPGNYGVEKFLELFSEENYDSFCLSYMFTYRDFQGGTLGLAWTGDLQQAGGVCERNGHYRGSKKSLNSGIISILNYGRRVPPAVSHVTFAHEIGHNFGSKHDPEQSDECTPGGVDGNYIMFARATSGDKRNNNKFSPCSLRAIAPVLRSKALSKRGCFIPAQAAICGNGVVEDDEECDCGWEEDCQERCCNPMSTQPTKLGAVPCTLRHAAVCSPSQGPCCDGSCRLTSGGLCRGDNGCRNDTFCNGRSAECPDSQLRADTTVCDEQSVCYKGECSGSICLAYGMESCQCLPGENDDEEKACELCCKLPGAGEPCRSSFKWNDAPFDVPDQYVRAGSPCKEYTGYCDVFKKCREVDPVGPLATLKDWLLSDRGLSLVKDFMDRYWYLIALALVAVILFLVAIIRIFGKSPHYRKRRRRRRPRDPSAKKHDGEAKTTAETAEPNPSSRTPTECAAAAANTVESGVTTVAARAQTDPAAAGGVTKKRVRDVRRAAHRARRAASQMAMSSKASVTSGVSRILDTRRRDKRSRHDGRDHTEQANGERPRKSRGRTAADKGRKKDTVRVISYTNKTAEVPESVDTEAEIRVASIPLKTKENSKEKRMSLPLNKANLFSIDTAKRRSLPQNAEAIAQLVQEEIARSNGRNNDQSRERKRGRSPAKREKPEQARSTSHQTGDHQQPELAKTRSRSVSPAKRNSPKQTEESARAVKASGQRRQTSRNRRNAEAEEEAKREVQTGKVKDPPADKLLAAQERPNGIKKSVRSGTKSGAHKHITSVKATQGRRKVYPNKSKVPQSGDVKSKPHRKSVNEKTKDGAKVQNGDASLRSLAMGPIKRAKVKQVRKPYVKKNPFSFQFSSDKLSQWLRKTGRNTDHSNTRQSIKNPPVPKEPMHPHEQVMHWLFKSVQEPPCDEQLDGMVSPGMARRNSADSPTVGCVRTRIPGASRTGYSRIASGDSSLSSGRKLSADPDCREPDTQRRSAYSGRDDTGTARPGYRRSKSHGQVPALLREITRETSVDRDHFCPGSSSDGPPVFRPVESEQGQEEGSSRVQLQFDRISSAAASSNSDGNRPSQGAATRRQSRQHGRSTVADRSSCIRPQLSTRADSHSKPPRVPRHASSTRHRSHSRHRQPLTPPLNGGSGADGAGREPMRQQSVSNSYPVSDPASPDCSASNQPSPLTVASSSGGSTGRSRSSREDAHPL